MKGRALAMEHLSLWELSEGNLGGGPLLGTLKDIKRKALEVHPSP